VSSRKTALTVAEIDGNGHRFVYATPSAAETFGWSAKELMQLSPKELFAPDSLVIVDADVRKISTGMETSMVLVEAIRKDGGHVWMENKVRVLKRTRNGGISVMVSMRDVTARKMLEERLARLASLDGLTGIANRRTFDHTLYRECARASRSGSSLALILIDVDNFKPFNDTYGHQTGDDCLRAIAHAAEGCARRAEDLVARYGGDELVLLLPNTPLSLAESLASELCASVANLSLPHAENPEGGGRVSITCGVSTTAHGVAELPAVRLIQSADAALYKAKRHGKNRVFTSCPSRRSEQSDSAREFEAVPTN
jgi:diguanylate cyclase (GGDEF)-like protein/PAS domain S-box-containing protein